MVTKIWPSVCLAETGVSIKVFMPFFDDKLLVFDYQVLRLGKLPGHHSYRLTKNDSAIHLENRLAATPLYMNVDRGVIVAVEEEPESVLVKTGGINSDLWTAAIIITRRKLSVQIEEKITSQLVQALH
jgi:hypothetical protein